jgi:hypothetical protein
MIIDAFAYLPPLIEVAIVLGFALVLASTAWGVVETKHRSRREF